MKISYAKKLTAKKANDLLNNPGGMAFINNEYNREVMATAVRSIIDGFHAKRAAEKLANA